MNLENLFYHSNLVRQIGRTAFIIMLVFLNACNIQPRNTLSDCREQCKGSNKSRACYEFCDCIHKEGKPLDECLNEYNESPEDSIALP